MCIRDSILTYIIPVAKEGLVDLIELEFGNEYLPDKTSGTSSKGIPGKTKAPSCNEKLLLSPIL